MSIPKQQYDDMTGLIKAVLITQIRVGLEKSETSLPIFGYDKVDIKRKALIHMQGIGINFSEKSLDHFEKFGYLLSSDHELEFRLKFFEKNS